MTCYQDCHRHFGHLTRETDIARKLLERHGKASAQAVKELRGDTGMSMEECANILRCLQRDMELERLRADNVKLQELIADVHKALCADRAGIFHKLILANMEDDMREMGVGGKSMSDNEIQYSPDMGGKEGLSALGFSRMLKRSDREEWYSETSEGIGVRVVFSFSFYENEWKCLTQFEHHGYAVSMFASATELNAIVRRINELVEGND